MEWRMYNHVSRVFAADFKQPAVVRTPYGPVEAATGDYLVVGDDFQNVRHYPAADFRRSFRLIDRPVLVRSLADLSRIAVQCVAAPDEGRAGTTCVRCGRQRTLTEFEGVPTCPECELGLKADREEAVRCQHDGTAMRKEVVQNVILDRCPECGGVWFDGGELDVLSAALEREAAYAVPTELASELLQSLVRGPPE